MSIGARARVSGSLGCHLMERRAEGPVEGSTRRKILPGTSSAMTSGSSQITKPPLEVTPASLLPKTAMLMTEVERQTFAGAEGEYDHRSNER